MKLDIKYCVVDVETKYHYFDDNKSIETIVEITQFESTSEALCEEWIINIVNSAIIIDNCQQKIYQQERNNPKEKNIDILIEIEVLRQAHADKFGYYMPDTSTEMRIIKKFCVNY